MSDVRSVIPIIKLFIIMISIVSSIKLKPSHYMKGRSLAMGAFGVKKLGQSVIDTTIPTVKDVESTPLFLLPSIGDGADERDIPHPEEDQNHATLSKMRKLLQQKNLLMGLEGGSWGEAEKLERIRLASTLDNMLPMSPAFASDSIKSPQLRAGGLMGEWDF